MIPTVLKILLKKNNGLKMLRSLIVVAMELLWSDGNCSNYIQDFFKLIYKKENINKMPLQLNFSIPYEREEILKAIETLKELSRESTIKVITESNEEVSDSESDSESEDEKEESIPKVCYKKRNDGTIECFCGSNLDLKNFPRHKNTVKHKLWESSKK